MLNAYLSSYEFNVVCFSEHWLHEHEVIYNKLDSYVLGNSYSRTGNIHGGVIIYVKESTKFHRLELDVFCEVFNLEVTGIVLEDFKLAILTIYRSGNGKINIFFERLETLLHSLSNLKYDLLIFGDFNVDLIPKSTLSLNLCNLFKSFGCFPSIYLPTRGESCIDNVYTNLNSQIIDACTFNPGLSDHNCIITRIQTCDTKKDKKKVSTFIYVRIFNDFNINVFKHALVNIRWEMILNHSDESNDCIFERFFNWFNDIFCKYFSLTRSNSQSKNEKKKKELVY